MRASGARTPPSALFAAGDAGGAFTAAAGATDDAQHVLDAFARSDGRAFLDKGPALDEHLLVGGQHAVGVDDPLGHSRGAGREEDLGDRVRTDGLVRPLDGIAGETVLYGPLCMNMDFVRASIMLPPLNVGEPLAMALDGRAPHREEGAGARLRARCGAVDARPDLSGETAAPGLAFPSGRERGPGCAHGGLQDPKSKW